jgi:hypothetical protein
VSKGRGWSRALLAVGAIASLSANVRHSFIPPKPGDVTAERWREYAAAYTDYSPAPESVVWAALVVLATWMSLEAIVRIRWDGHRLLGFVVKALLSVTVFAVALVASYNHMTSLLEYAGAGWFEVTFGPALPDGMMVLGTAGLIVDSFLKDTPADKGPSLAARVAALRATTVDTIAAAKGADMDKALVVHTDKIVAVDNYRDAPEFTDLSPIAQVVSGTSDRIEWVPPTQDVSSSVPSDMDMDMLPVLPVDMDKPARKTRAVSWDKAKAVSLLDTATDKEIGAEVGVSYKSIQRLRRPVSQMRDTIMTDKEIAQDNGMSLAAVRELRDIVRESMSL